ncbi:MFS transporter [Streptomyces sp. CA-111067]|uniref:MFS transporter n=1 Tax=Streptomyces sp. CA-111067 TaxID=3240046 RepID=UPI003D99C146
MPVTPFRPDGAVPRYVRLLIAARGVNQLGAFSLAFLTVLLCRDFGTSTAAAGAVATAFGVATIPSRLLGGRLADRIGRRRTILIGLLGCAAAQLGIAAAPSLPAAAGWAVLLGLAFELYEPPSQAMIADGTRPEARARTYALLTTALAVGNTGAGLIAAIVGRSNLRWLFAIDAASCLVCALAVRLGTPADRAALSSGTAADRAAGAVTDAPDVKQPSPWRDRALLAVTAAGTVYALVYMVLLMALPLSLAASGLNPASAGVLMTAATVVIVVARPLMRTRLLADLPAPAASAAGYVLMAAGLAGYAFAPAGSLPALLAPTAAWSLGNLLLSGQAFAVVAGLAPAGASARYLAVFGLSWGFATVAAPPLGTWLIGGFGPATLWTSMAVVCLAMGVVQPCLLRALADDSGPAGPPAPVLTKAGAQR